MQRIDDIVNLLKDYLAGDLDTQRRAELERLFTEYPQLKEIVEELDSEEELREALYAYEELYTPAFKEREERVLNRVLSQIDQQPPIRRTRLLSRRFAIYSAAAAIAVLVLFAAILWKQKVVQPNTTEEIVSTFMPGGNKALLTLSTGQEVNLSDAYAGIVVDDQIGYEDGSALFDEDSMEEHMTLTLSTPRGGQYQVTLSDGTKVWLNAESKLHYPYRFAGDARQVELEGEAYFEVAHRDNAPFIVTTSKEKVEVLGTHFNINSYRTDMNSTVALLEGKVKVSLTDKVSAVLKPGQQSLVHNGMMEVQAIDLDESVAWKNGEFMFNNETLENVAKKIARWYDLEIEVSPKLNDIKIWGSVSRYDSFKQVLKLIKMTDESIRLEVEERRVKFVR